MYLDANVNLIAQSDSLHETGYLILQERAENIIIWALNKSDFGFLHNSQSLQL